MTYLLNAFLSDERTRWGGDALFVQSTEALVDAYRADRLPDWRQIGPALVYVAALGAGGRFEFRATGRCIAGAGLDIHSAPPDVGDLGANWRSDVNHAVACKSGIVSAYQFGARNASAVHLVLPFLRDGESVGLLGVIAVEDAAGLDEVVSRFARARRRMRPQSLKPPMDHFFPTAGKIDGRLWRSISGEEGPQTTTGV